MSDATRPTDPVCRFHFVSPELTLEFSGSPEYVNSQVEHFQGAIRRALGEEAPAAAAAPDTGTPTTGKDDSGRSDLERFMKAARTRVGRGALQERILLFIHYRTPEKGREEAGTEDINFCFDLLSLERPKSLANTLGIMKRNQGVLESGSRRGTYCVTDKGRKKVKSLMI
jgi:hypothetical protein